LNGSGVVDLVKTTSNINFTWPATFGRRHHSPLPIIYFVSLYEDYIQMSFFFGSPKIGSLVVPQFWTFTFFSNQVFFENTSTISYSP